MLDRAFVTSHVIPSAGEGSSDVSTLLGSGDSSSQAHREDVPGGAIFIPFLMAGHPSRAVSVEAIMMLAAEGAGIIEVGVPFSDPTADGPVNQRAAEIALKNGMTLAGVLEIIREVRAQGCQTPIVLFSYYNPILAMGEQVFLKQASDVGVSGVLIVDLPPEEGEVFYTQLKQAGMGVILLVSPTTDKNRFPLYRKIAPSFLYYISRLSVTGMQQALASGVEEEVRTLKAAFPGMKVVVGFGISTPEQAALVAKFAEGVVVGSHLVKTLEEQGLEACRLSVRRFVEAVL